MGIGFLNTGSFARQEVTNNQLGLRRVTFFQNYNYVFIPIGAKISIGSYYALPEIGLAFNVSNKTRQITEFTDGQVVKETRDMQLNFGTHNPLTIPLNIAIGRNINVGKFSFSTGIKGYYSLNQVVKDVVRDNQYFGFGIFIGMEL